MGKNILMKFEIDTSGLIGTREQLSHFTYCFKDLLLRCSCVERFHALESLVAHRKENRTGKCGHLEFRIAKAKLAMLKRLHPFPADWDERIIKQVHIIGLI
jgi:hypothetical protein